jgi:3,4-dihydroxy 2-butanone 4-phosphate synthase/GTP cyclohydrolase II
MLDWLTKRARSIWRRAQGKPFVERVAAAKLPTDYGEFDIFAYEDSVDGLTHVALVHGDLGNGENVITRVHSSCLTGDVFHSARCDCGSQLDTAMKRVADEGRGIILYLNQEGRGIGLANKIRAYSLQDEGFDTVEANERLGLPVDKREYGVSVRMLLDLGVKSVRLLSNNPRKLAGVTGKGLSVSERIPIEIQAGEFNERYLKTKKDKLGHELTSV